MTHDDQTNFYLNIQNMIEVTGCDLRVLTKTAYRLSGPMGTGHLPFIYDGQDTPKEGELDDSDTDIIVAQEEGDPYVALCMCYVRYRAVKMTVFRYDPPNSQVPERWFIDNTWEDHADFQLHELLRAIGKETMHHERTG